MRAKLKGVVCADVDALETYYPHDPGDFELSLQLFIGPEDADGEEAFGLTVCSPNRLGRIVAEQGDILSGEKYLFVSEYDLPLIRRYLEKRISACTGDSWGEIVQCLATFLYWEFENYQS